MGLRRIDPGHRSPPSALTAWLWVLALGGIALWLALVLFWR